MGWAFKNQNQDRKIWIIIWGSYPVVSVFGSMREGKKAVVTDHSDGVQALRSRLVNSTSPGLFHPDPGI